MVVVSDYYSKEIQYDNNKELRLSIGQNACIHDHVKIGCKFAVATIVQTLQSSLRFRLLLVAVKNCQRRDCK